MSKIQLLLTDDDGIILATFGSGLREAGYDVIEAISGEAALQIVKERQVDLAILDVDMPGLSGIDTARKMRELKVPVIFLSAHAGNQLVEAAVAEGALGYVIKPIDVVKVIPTIEAALERANELKTSKETENRLNSALNTGNVANVVVGMTMERYRINQDEAFELLRQQARSERRKVREVASDMISAWETLNRLKPNTSNTKNGPLKF
ncbi:MAG: response regulator [Candidatus Polarisedimenticolaceae bacterium]|nr:response regulator [Candidatus Polarisedimenticolaceae bacterium]